ncbi:uncharacterized protein CG3556-like isoform X2 [Centruroides sculpturatus]|uniref:uncharacterized protein CG3556-like isoform X2 n=1 Tax=Centruroides sculpturatus TaxID=218467 RepID=UPI000C6CBB1F|nr:uncharacterized protein CG3556-like isoform X2 [Centruroides sculpturatus]
MIVIAVSFIILLHYFVECFQINSTLGNFGCGENRTRCRSEKCIPNSWICDGYIDCPDKLDEIICPVKHYNMVLSAEKKAAEWILKQRKQNGNWGENTPKAIIALFLANKLNFSVENLENEVILKSLEVQILSNLIRNATNSYNKMIQYIHGRLATCRNPYNFNGYNLIKALNDKMSEDVYINPSAYLALCNAGYNISAKNIEKLFVMNITLDTMYNVDATALKILAMICIYEKSKNEHLQHFINANLNAIKSLQNPDGSFGNVYTTALVVQALIASNKFNDLNFTKTVMYILDQQLPSGSFGDILATYLILPILSHKTLLDLSKVSCSYTKDEKPRNVTIYSKNYRGKNRISYSVWIGDEGSITHSIHLLVPNSITLYEIMQVAQDLDKSFKFKWNYLNGKRHVYCINSIINNPENEKYWVLYKRRNNQKLLTISEDINRVYATEGDDFIFWYQTLYLK